MYKKIPLLIVLLFTYNLISQTVDVVTGLNHPVGIAINGDELFIAEHSHGPGSGIISKADLSIVNPTTEDLITGLTYPRAVCLVGDELYYATSNLWKFNINDSNPTPTQVIYANSPRALIATDDEMFVSGDDRISKIDLNSANPSLQLVVNNIEARILAFALKGDELYFGYSNKVSKINITDANPVVEEVITGFESNIYSLAFFGDTLIVGMALNYKLVTIDMNDSVLIAEDFIDNMSGQPMNLLVHNNELFIAGGQGDKVFKVEDLGTLLGIKKQNPFLTLRMYPNPTSDFIQISGLNERIQYEIYNTNGAKVFEGTLEPKSQIDISRLSSGMYNLKLMDGTKKATYFKVIKQ